jgi:gluconolactonase
MRPFFVPLLFGLAAAAQDLSRIEIVKVAAGYTFTEGPEWSREGFLLFSDVPSDRILRFTPGKGTDVYRDNSGGANGNAFDAKGRLYTCENRSRRLTRTDRKGRVEVLLEKWEGKRLNAPNDVIIRRDGHLYFTDPAFGAQEDGRELDFYGVYHLSPKGEAELIARPKGRPNGVALSPGGNLLYVANTDERRLYAYDLDRQGRASNERVVIENTDGPPDGLAVDEKGNLYVTANGLSIYSPDGKLIHRAELAERPTNCAFGGGDLQTLFITAQTSVYAIRLDVKGVLEY